MKKDKRKLWVVTELFFPEETSTAYIMTKISEHFARDTEVHVICGPAAYQKSNLVATEALNANITITRVKTPGLNKDKLLQRALRMALLSIQLTYKLWRKAGRGDNVLIVTNPAPVVPLVTWVCRWKSLKCFTIVHDVFPENLVAAKIMKPGSLPYRLLKSVFNKAYSNMAVLFVLGRDMKAVFESKLQGYKKQPDIKIVENWADTVSIAPTAKDENPVIRKLGVADKIIFQFAGNLGRVQGLMELCHVIKDIRNPLLHFIFIGEGAVKKEMLQFIAKHQLSNVSMLDSFSRSKQQEFLNATDVGIVSLQEGMAGLGVPSKSYNILAAGKPILFIGNANSEISLMINEHNVGWTFDVSESAALLDFFNGLSVTDVAQLTQKGKNARALAVNNYAQDIILDKYVKLTMSEN
ncbi:glycosyltransferase family 4 protein [Chitinophaga sp. ARDCPP14]|uniref:glycosyltransferase family 4 protein n=1 Tax=Chitinophaga sp. ARDCPP14 TaxID=3391139 RepID=UPI003F521BFC